ncbi:6-phosphogluconolactonase [Rubripirellula obstinata]|uniref:6-phosphogluconolactonase n=1 Tax=Rubripirellula obstinata TaxID=406547 RepID=A0A5B1CRC0_9BACT|nr:lactonase family protein [Rubripirellula obstinata]KAA1262515.1 6-phosphogluconolactonase [Rubripirellula obstinata]
MPDRLILTVITFACLILGGDTLKVCSAESIDIWIGTSNRPPSRGIYQAQMNLGTGKLSKPRLAAELKGPGFLALHPTLDNLYAIGTPIDGEPSVVAYNIGRPKNQLSLVNSVAIGDGGAAHLAIDQTGKLLLTAQYSGGSVGVFRLNEDGSIKDRTQLVKHKGGSGVVGNRQDAPHPHWVGFSPDNQYAFVPDLGLDQVVIYRIDHDEAKLLPHGDVELPPGSGSRHMKFHPNGKWAYVLNELSLTVTQLIWNPEAGTLSPMETLPTVPKKALEKESFKSASEIRIHPSGRFLYCGNRGHDTITVCRINQRSGSLSRVEIENSRSAMPRNFNLTPDGKWLVVAGQDSHTVASFSVDQNSGTLQYSQHIVQAPSPICILFQR